MKTQSFKLFVVCLVIYLFLYIANRMGYVFPNLIQFYLSDLLAVPIVATLALWFMRWVLQKRDLLLQRWQLVFIVLFFSFIFEALLPSFMERYTGDIVDVICYLVGGLFFWNFLNKPGMKHSF